MVKKVITSVIKNVIPTSCYGILLRLLNVYNIFKSSIYRLFFRKRDGFSERICMSPNFKKYTITYKGSDYNVCIDPLIIDINEFYSSFKWIIEKSFIYACLNTKIESIDCTDDINEFMYIADSNKIIDTFIKYVNENVNYKNVISLYTIDINIHETTTPINVDNNSQ